MLGSNVIFTNFEEMGNFNIDAGVCEFCGTPKKWKHHAFKIGSVHKVVSCSISQCKCLQEQEAEEKKKQLEKEAKLQERAEEMELQRRFDNSMLTPFFKQKQFENVEMTEQIKQVKKFADNFKPHIKGLQLVGSVGTGKTTALACVCNELIKKGYKCLFVTLSSLIDKFAKCSYEEHGDISSQLNWLLKYDFIVLDDIGRETYTDKRKELVFRIVDALMNYEMTVCYTANPQMLEKLLKIPEMVAALDRLKFFCPEIVQFKGNSRR